MTRQINQWGTGLRSHPRIFASMRLMLVCVLAWEILQIWQGDEPQVADDAAVSPPRRIVERCDIFISASWYPVASGDIGQKPTFTA
ncbi:hypothetical protein [Burkholderia sp. LMU1-1-1.1]|uniref:hypothetical protein n=1 Tax=Burkholderia sp. LMU1-1-1.1 TaxID=3135266 RepID=UPI003443D2F4